MTQASLTIRLFSERDSLEKLTDLLHRSYAIHKMQGFNYSAVSQSVESTARRIAQGECWIAEQGEKIIGTVTLTLNMLPTTCGWYQREDVVELNQFAVDPTEQQKGIGSKLLQFIETRAAELGYAELTLDTAEGAVRLIQWYQKRDYRVIEYAQWQGKTYRSVILSKPLSGIVFD